MNADPSLPPGGHSPQTGCSHPTRSRRRATRAAAAWGTAAGVLALLASLGAWAPADSGSILGESAALAPAADDEDSGWFLRLGSTSAGARRDEFKAHAPTASFALEPGQGLLPGAPIDNFIATFDSTLTIDAAGKYRFGAEAEGGTLRINVYGSSLREPVTLTFSADRTERRMSRWADLPAGPVNVQFTFTRTDGARARMRPLWERQGIGKLGFRTETIPVEATRPIGMGSRDVEAWKTAQHGRVLLGELGCVSCHTGSNIDAVTMRREAPTLAGISGRADPAWIRKWIAMPQMFKPGCGMPAVITGADAMETVRNVAEFLRSTGPEFEYQAAATEPAGLELGRHAYQTFGCVACHGVPGSTEVKAPHPHTGIAGKWNPSALAAFIADPLKSHPGGRMPSLNLKPQEADLIASYLVNAWGQGKEPAAPPPLDPRRVEAGRTAFAAIGCASCHEMGGDAPAVAPTLSAKPLASLNARAGCLDPSDRTTPRYTLSDPDRDALVAAIEQIKGWTLPPSTSQRPVYPLDSLEISFRALGCVNCHEYNGVGGVDPSAAPLFATLGEADLGDEGKIPPRLNGVGAKLNSQWLSTVLSEGAKGRAYMAARMPVFGAHHTDRLVTLLAQADGVWPNTDKQDPKVSDRQTQLGRRLVGEKGLNCISCHVVGNNPPAGTAGPDITQFAARLRYEWWSDYIHAPIRFKPGTRMPSFFESGSSTITDVLSGDPEMQADAMWAYFTLGDFMPAPEGLVKSSGFKVSVGTRPVILRTFLKDAGSRGIAVGFPQPMGGIHFAFDAERVRLADAWKNDFLDASGAWAGRGGNVVGGQGATLWTAPGGPAIIVSADAPAQWPSASGRETGVKFRGYQIDDRGVPTFNYSFKPAGEPEVFIGERAEPTPAGEIKRSFQISGLPSGATVWFNPGPNATISGTPMNATPLAPRPDGVLGFKAEKADATVSFGVVIKP